jgi:hypothetical protein
MRSILLLSLACWLSPALMAQPQSPADVFDPGSVKELRLYLEEKNWDVILDSLKQQGENYRLLGDAYYNDVKYEGIGIRYKGNSSYFNVSKAGYTKLPFNIDINRTHKKLALPGGYNKLKLSNIFRDPSFVREVLSYEIVRRYMPAPNANFIQLYVNDEYFGVYNNTESVEGDFLKGYFGTDKGVLIKCDPPAWGLKPPDGCLQGEKSSLEFLGKDSTCYTVNYELKSDYGWQELANLAYILNHQIDKLDSVFNIDQALWMLALNMVMVNLDSYTGRFCHNYYLYQDPVGGFHPIIWDLNLSFGGFRYDGINNSPLSNEEMQTLSPILHYRQKNEKRPLITNLLADETYRKMYLASIRTILNDYFINGLYLQRAEEIQDLVDQFVKEDDNKLYSYDAFKKNLRETAKADKVNVIGIAELMGPRTEYLAKHPLIDKAPPSIQTHDHLDFKDIIAFQMTLEDAERAWLFYRYGNTGAFRRLEMFDDGGHNDRVANDGIWGATLDVRPGDQEIQYFYVAENQFAAARLPERASLEFFSVKLEGAPKPK